MPEKKYTFPTQWIIDHVLVDAYHAASFQNRLDLVKSKYETYCILNRAGGIFKIDQNMLSFLHSASSIYKTKSHYVTDTRGIPVMVPNAKEFYLHALEVYNTASKDYYEAVTEIIEGRAKEI